MKERKNPHEITMLIWSLLGETAAYIVALLFRYVILEPMYPNKTREYEFYRMFYIFLLLAYSFVFFMRRTKVRHAWEMDFWGKIAEVIKSQTLLLFIELFFIFFINWDKRISRTVVAILFVFGILFDIFARRQYARRYIRKYGSSVKHRNIIMIAEAEEKDRLKFCIERYGYLNERKDIWDIHTVVGVYEAQDVKKEKLSIPKGCAMIYVSAAAAEKLGEKEKTYLRSLGIPVSYAVKAEGRSLPERVMINEGGSAAVFESYMHRKFPVLGVEYTTAGCTEAAAYVLDHVKELGGNYICFSNVHTTVMASDDKSYRDILNGSALTFPDGNPIASKIALGGYPEAERVAGPDFMEEAFRLSMESGEKHFFYGSSEKTINCLKEKLKERFPYMNVVGMYSPPFRELTEEEDAADIKMINDSGADLVWIGLGAPKQEKWMAAHKGKINGVMLGVGAGFDFHAGTIDRAPKLIQGIGLEWLYRLFQNPRRLFKRYLVTNTKFILYSKFKKKK